MVRIPPSPSWWLIPAIALTLALPGAQPILGVDGLELTTENAFATGSVLGPPTHGVDVGPTSSLGTVLADITIGGGWDNGMVVDPGNSEVYVVTTETSNVSAISGTTLVGNSISL